jgi:ferrous iron transport protein A
MNAGEMPLNQLPIGIKGRVMSLACEGAARRRMLDLGLINGTEIEPLYKSSAGNPVAYLIRGAVIALRSNVSGRIMVSTS